VRFGAVKRLLVRILIGIMVISNFYIAMRDNKVEENSSSNLTGGIADDKASANVKLYAVAAPGIPTSLKAVSFSYNSIKISWGAVTGATGYQIYRATSSSGSYSLLMTTSSTSYTNTSLTTGKTYYYKVRAYKTVESSRAYSSFSSVVSAKPIPSTPASVKAVSASYNSIKISWGVVAGASQYQIYRATSSTGSYSWLMTTSSTSYTNTGLTTGKTYYYKVRTYKTVGSSRIYSNFSSVVSTKPIPSTPASVKAASTSYNSIKISWGAVPGASQYQIYRATSSTGSYSCLMTTSSTSYVNTGLTTGKTYYYKVRAFKTVVDTRVYGNYSTIVSTKAVPSVPLGVIAVSDLYNNSIKAAWRAVTGASGYEVYRAASNTGTYTFVSTAIGTSYTNTGLTRGKTYYYKVRAYTIVGTTKIYGNYSIVASCLLSVKGYVHNLNLQNDLKVRSAPSLTGSELGYLYNYEKIEILDSVVDANDRTWDKFIYKGSAAYVSDAYIIRYSSPPDNAADIATSITKQFEVGTSNQIAGNSDGQGLSLGYFQWCIGQGSLQPLLHRMDRQYTYEMKIIFGTNYGEIHNMIYNTPSGQLDWAEKINDSTNKVIEPWYSQFVNLTKNQHFLNIEKDAEAYYVKRAMAICDKYGLKTVRGLALALDIAVQNGSISSGAAVIIDTALKGNPNMAEKDLLRVIANAVADSSDSNSADIRSRKMAIVNGQGVVHGSMLYLDKDYGLSDNYWR
jgi:fibronectin type 3 domain-containing protein